MTKILKQPFLYLLLIAGACEYENEQELFGNEPCATAVVFTNQVQPIIQANCAVSGCHISGGMPPELTSYEKVKARAQDVRNLTHSRQMPPPYSSRALTTEEIALIDCWVKQGAPRD